jgi:Ca2+-binding RTX toxin-like protein
VRIASNLKLPTTLMGGEGNDTLVGGLRSDSIDGGNGDDRISGGRAGSAKNFLTGGDGADTIFGASILDDVTHPDDGVVDHITIFVSDSDDIHGIGSIGKPEDIVAIRNILRVTAEAHVAQ